MNANKIEGVKPFNSFFYRSCYYHQLISALSCFGIDEDNVLCNVFPVLSENFLVENNEMISENELLKYVGCKMVKCNLSKYKLFKNIDRGNPIIVGVDSYYLESRRDTYGREHVMHYVLVLGYNKKKDEAYVVDHNYVNSWHFEEKTISLSNLLLAENKYCKSNVKYKYTSKIIKNVDSKLNSTYLELWKHLPAENFERNRMISERNLLALKEIITGESEILEQKSPVITEYMNKVCEFYKSFSYIKIMQEQKYNIVVSRLASAYGVICSLLWKLAAKRNYLITEEQKEKLMRKIDEIIETEEKMYKIMETLFNE